MGCKNMKIVDIYYFYFKKEVNQVIEPLNRLYHVYCQAELILQYKKVLTE